MLFFNPFFLARQLRDNALSEDALFRFVIVAIIFQGMERLMDVLTGSAAIVRWCITIAGVYLAHRTNKRGGNCHFVERWLCLNVLLWWWICLVPYALDVLLYHIIAHHGLASLAVLRSLAPFMQAWVGGLYVFFYVALNFLIRIAASNPTSSRDLTVFSLSPAPTAPP